MIKSTRKLTFDCGLELAVGENTEPVDVASLPPHVVRKLQYYVGEKVIEVPEGLFDPPVADAPAAESAAPESEAAPEAAALPQLPAHEPVAEQPAKKGKKPEAP